MLSVLLSRYRTNATPAVGDFKNGVVSKTKSIHEANRKFVEMYMSGRVAKL
jgi:hypothetical protein